MARVDRLDQDPLRGDQQRQGFAGGPLEQDFFSGFRLKVLPGRTLGAICSVRFSIRADDGGRLNRLRSHGISRIGRIPRDFSWH